MLAVDGIRRKLATHTLEVLKRYRHDHPGALQDVHSDGGGEWLGKFSEYCRENGIAQSFTCPYSEFQNSQAERMVGISKRGARTGLGTIRTAQGT